jgi:hypothetical protein
MTDSHKLKIDRISSTTETSLFYGKISAFNFKGAGRGTAPEIPLKFVVVCDSVSMLVEAVL